MSKRYQVRVARGDALGVIDQLSGEWVRCDDGEVYLTRNIGRASLLADNLSRSLGLVTCP